MSRYWFAVCVIALTAAPLTFAQTREQKVRADRDKVTAEGFWIYNDLPKGIAEAKKTGKPLLVVLRCIPCEECVKLDDELVDTNPRVRPLLDKYVCVRVVSTNGLDLNLFQFDTDQSFAAFLLNADGTIYGRYGTRSHRTYWSDDVSVEGLAQALEGGLELHANYPKSAMGLAKKRGPKPEFASPELMPGLKGKYTNALNYAGNVVQSCIHCHQIGDALRDHSRKGGQVPPDHLLFPYPHPKALGLILDPKQRATVLRVEPNTPASAAGFSAGDRILALDGQPPLSIADVQWVLHNTPATGATVTAEIERKGSRQKLALKLEPGWRERDDISWRVSSWGLRRMTTGGIVFEDLPTEERAQLKLKPDTMALRAKYVGEFGPHAAAKNAGFRKGDVIISFDGKTDLLRETDVLVYALREHQPGDKVPVTLLRNGKMMQLTLPMQP